MSAKISLKRKNREGRWKEKVKVKERRRKEKWIHHPMKRGIDWFTCGIKGRNT
jgi:hypothetical protein